MPFLLSGHRCVQATIDAAAKKGNGAAAYFASGTYNINTSVTIPNGEQYTLQLLAHLQFSLIESRICLSDIVALYHARVLKARICVVYARTISSHLFGVIYLPMLVFRFTIEGNYSVLGNGFNTIFQWSDNKDHANPAVGSVLSTL